LRHDHLRTRDAAREKHSHGASAVLAADQCASKRCEQKYPKGARVPPREGQGYWEGEEIGCTAVCCAPPTDAGADSDGEQREQVDEGVEAQEDAKEPLAERPTANDEEVPEREPPGVRQPIGWGGDAIAGCKPRDTQVHAWPPCGARAPGGS